MQTVPQLTIRGTAADSVSRIGMKTDIASIAAHDTLTARERLLRQKLSRTASAEGRAGVQQQDLNGQSMTSEAESPHVERDESQKLAPPRVWGLAEYGIPAPSQDILPDPAIEVSHIPTKS